MSKVKDGAELVDNSGKTLSEIVDSVQKVSSIISDIAVASNEQSIGIHGIDTVIRDVDDITRKNSVMVKNAATNSRSLENQASVLTGLIEHFNLDKKQNVTMTASGHAGLNQYESESPAGFVDGTNQRAA